MVLMREILFRGKNLKAYDKNESWIYGVPLINHRGECEMHLENVIRLVQGETIGQYIGKTDKNGVKVFEGDILACEEFPYTSKGQHAYLAEVRWMDDEDRASFGLRIFHNPNSTIFEESSFWDRFMGYNYIDEFFSIDNWEVIGNIHDNPELLD